MTEMPVDKALENVDYRGERFTTLEERSLAAEVRRLREENSKLLASGLESCAKIHIGREVLLEIERDRYREALERIVSGYDFTAPENMLYIARDAIRGGEE